MKCLNCAQNNPDEAIYCQNCATYLVERSSTDLLDLLRSLVLALIVTSIFYLVFPLPQIRSDYIHDLFDGLVVFEDGESRQVVYILHLRLRQCCVLYAACANAAISFVTECAVCCSVCAVYVGTCTERPE